MPANLTPEYRAAEAAFRKARDPSQRLEWLREMLRVIPKHNGTDHLQGDIEWHRGGQLLQRRAVRNSWVVRSERPAARS